MDQAAEQAFGLTRQCIALNSELTRLLSKSRIMRTNEDAQIYKHVQTAFASMVDEITAFTDDHQWHRKVIAAGPFTLKVTAIPYAGDETSSVSATGTNARPGQ